jgi:NADPH:quinone reductase-like Zn-dependent oxidoreductase
MEAIFLVKNGKPELAFERRDISLKKPDPDEVSIEVEAFGLNFADVTGRLGLYKECPPLPTVIGYEVVGRIMDMGNDATHVAIGDRVIGFTIFGGYATHVVTKAKAVAKIDDAYPVGKALALTVQYCTAYYATNFASHVFENDKVLIHAGAGGVGTALIQLCKLKKCKIYATAGSPEKIEYLKGQGVDFPINYNMVDFDSMINEKLDVVFDSIGGKTFKKGIKLLDYGGRMVSFGAASQLEARNIFSKIKFAFSFGIYHPVMFIMGSKTLAGVNMLKIGQYKPDILQNCMQNIVKLANEGKIDPHVGGTFSIDKLNEAHTALETRNSIGKLGIIW